MQAVILADTMGRRLGDYTSDIPKCMVEVNSVRLIDRVIGQLKCLGVERIIIVDGYKSEILRNHVEEVCKDIPILFIENDLYASTNNIFSLWLAINYLLDDDTILLESDLIFDGELLRNLWESPYKDAALISKYKEWMNGTMVEIDAEDNIVKFIPKDRFKDNETHRYYKTVNIYKFSPEFIVRYLLPFLEAYMNAFGTDDYYEEVLRIITSAGKYFIKGVPSGALQWYEIDDIEDLANAARIFPKG